MMVFALDGKRIFLPNDTCAPTDKMNRALSFLSTGQADRDDDDKAVAPVSDGVTVDLSFILLQILLPMLLDLFLALDVARTLDGLQNVTQCAQVSPSWSNDVYTDISCITSSGSYCLFNNASLEAPEYVAQTFSTLPPFNPQATFLGEVGIRQPTLRAIGLVFTAFAVLTSLVAVFARRSKITLVMILINSFLASVLEIIALANLNSYIGTGPQTRAFWSGPLYLMFAALFGSLFAFISDVVGEGDAAVLTNLGVVHRVPRWAILCGFHGVNVACVVLNGIGMHQALEGGATVL